MSSENLARLLYAWRVAQVEGFSKSDVEAIEFQERLTNALRKNDAKFFSALARTIQKGNPSPWQPKTALEKVRLAYVSFDPEIHPTWDEVKKLVRKLYGLKLTPRHWQRLRREAGLSSLPGPRLGRPRKSRTQKKN